MKVKVKLKPDAPDGSVLGCGVHDPQSGKGLANWSIRASQVRDGEWQWHELGDFLPSGSPYFWISGGGFDTKKYPDNPCAEQILVDQFEISRRD